jgi:hypothetical protein
LDKKRAEDILDKLKAEPLEKKLAEYKQKWLNRVSRL